MAKNEKVMDRLLDLENGLFIWRVHVDLLREQDKNARVMSPYKFERLVANIKEDKKLESLPLVMKKQERNEFEIISGHHRIRASRDAGIQEVYVLAYEDELTPDQVRSKQLAHNSLSGIDDEQVLREIYMGIEDLEARMATGLKTLEDELNVGTISVDEISVDMDYEILNIVFLPMEKAKFEDAISMIEKKAGVLVEKLDSFESFKEAIRATGFAEDIRNISCILGKMAEIIIEHYGNKEEKSRE